MTRFVQDADFTLYVGDVREVLAGLEDGSVDCVITSPPYWGLRDYGTDGQLGLEPTPDQYVETMVGVFREVRRVLADHGTMFLNLGDSYASLPVSRMRGNGNSAGAGAGSVSEVLSPVSSEAVAGGEPGQGTRATGAELPEEQGGSDSSSGGTATKASGGDHGEAGEPLPVLRGDAAGVLDDRPRTERRSEGQEDGAAPSAQADMGRGMPAGQVPDPLLELQRSEGDAGCLSSFGDLKQKDLVGIPWMLAFALRADGWYLRSDIIWAKPNPMPESVTDRPTKAHEYVFLLAKRPRYWFDAEAVREPAEYGRKGWADAAGTLRRAGGDPERSQNGNATWKGCDPSAGRNVRTVWEIPTQPYPEAHFATYPEELVRRCLLAGCPEWVCSTCGKPRERIVERPGVAHGESAEAPGTNSQNYGGVGKKTTGGGQARQAWLDEHPKETVGWSDCGCRSSDGGKLGRPRRRPPDLSSPRIDGWLECGCGKVAGSDDATGVDAHNAENPAPRSNYRPGVVLDPFLGSGTTAQVARRYGRHCVGIELNPAYAQLAAKRLQQLSLLT